MNRFAFSRSSALYSLRDQAVFVYGTGLAMGLHLALVHVFVFRDWRVVPMTLIATVFFCTVILGLWHWVFPLTVALSPARRLGLQLLVAAGAFIALSTMFTELNALLLSSRGLFSPYDGGDRTVTIPGQVIRWAPLVYTLIPVIPTALICVVGFNMHWWRILRMAGEHQELRDLAVSAQLATLRAQVNPHFFFNSLNSIAQLISADPDKAERCVERLAEIYRYILSRSQVEFVSLADELAIAEAYLEIEKARFGEDLSVEQMVDERVREVRLPGLILQPLVENAVKHGISRKIGGGTVTILAGIDDGALCLTVRDTGNGISDRERVFDRGVGLRNVRERLMKLYGPAYAPVVESVPGGGTSVTLRIPVLADQMVAA